MQVKKCVGHRNRVKKSHAQIYKCVSETKNGGFYFKNQKYFCIFLIYNLTKTSIK